MLLLLIMCVTGCFTKRKYRDPVLEEVVTTPTPSANMLDGSPIGYLSPYDAPLPPLEPGRYGSLGNDINLRRRTTANGSEFEL